MCVPEPSPLARKLALNNSVTLPLLHLTASGKKDIPMVTWQHWLTTVVCLLLLWRLGQPVCESVPKRALLLPSRFLQAVDRFADNARSYR